MFLDPGCQKAGDRMDFSLISVLVLALTGSAIGFASGFFGVGGGFLMVPVQYWLLTGLGVDPTLSLRIAFGTSLAVIVPTALSGTWGHHCRHCVLVRPLALMAVPGIMGTVAGAAIATHAPGRLMECLFGVLLLIAAVLMLFSPVPSGESTIRKPPLLYLFWGGMFGFVSGLFGIGGGLVMIPVMTTILGIPLRQAIGTSTAFMLCSSVTGVVSYIAGGIRVPGLPPFSLGYVNVMFWAILSLASVPFALLGVRAAHTVHPAKIRLFFILLMAGVGGSMIISGA